MKFRNNLKRFFTLDRHHAEGFTLVELIVVIAILAILAGVAVPAYSGYVTQANKAADQQLVSDVKHALELGFYAGTLKENGTVILHYGKAPVVDASAVESMTAVFGTNLDSLTLKYNNWGFSTVGQSTWMQSTGVNELLNEVTDLTGSVLTLLGSQSTPEKLYENMFENLDEDVLNELCAQKGIAIDTSGAQPKFADDVTNEQLANLMVLAAAQEITNMGSDNAYDYMTGNGDAEVSTMLGLVQTFAVINGFSKSEYATDEQKQTYADLEAKLASGDLTNTTEIGNALNECLVSFFPEEVEDGVEYPIDLYYANCFDNDMRALVDIMGTVSQVAPSINGADLKDADFYATNDTIGTMFSAYADAAKSGDKCIMIGYVLDANGGLYVMDSSAK